LKVVLRLLQPWKMMSKVPDVDISPDLTENQKAQLIALITRHSSAFGLDGKLGNYSGKVEVTMKLGTVPISLPPYHASPANREVIDKQMDAWIELGVIEPSKSPWAAPVFIVYCNNKPRMELFTLLHLFLPDSYWTPGILPDWTRTRTNFMLADHHTNFVSQS